MKIVLAIIAASCIVACTKAISCYQCQDVAMRFTDPAVAEMIEQNADAGDGEAPPKCDSSHMAACGNDNFVCAATDMIYSVKVGEVSMETEMVIRTCLPPALEETYCSTMQGAMTSTSDVTLDFKSCEVHVCSTDNCNTQGMERFQDDEEREKYVSSETKLTISFLLIQLVSFLAVAFL